MSSPSLHVTAIKPPDGEWRKMKAVWDACKAAKIEPPHEVVLFFNGEAPDDKGVLMPLTSYKHQHACVTPYAADMREGYDVDLSKLPEGAKILRFIASY